MIETTVSHYRIISKLGGGGMNSDPSLNKIGTVLRPFIGQNGGQLLNLEQLFGEATILLLVMVAMIAAAVAPVKPQSGPRLLSAISATSRLKRANPMRHARLAQAGGQTQPATNVAQPWLRAAADS